MAVMAQARTRAVVQRASAALLSEGVLAAPMLLKGSDALVFYREDQGECARRRESRAAALDRIDVLATLLQLPVDQPVALASLTPQLRAAVHALPQGAAQVADGQVVRRAVRPLAVDLVVVRSTSPGWRDGLVRAGRFAPFARRALLVDPPAGEREDLLMQAAFYGIGLLMPTGSGAELMVEPGTYRPRRYTAAAWCFVEEFHQRLARRAEAP